ncbi:MAG: caspase family protein [Rubrivivax sp.]|nr:caspase family protein [Rubrivivax sp.]
MALACWLASMVLTPGAAAQTARRVALVIGNNAYAAAPLRNPVNDAREMAQALRGAGFSVTVQFDATLPEMAQALRAFGEQLRQGAPDAVGLFYFAGHGMQIKGRNFLIPVGADIAHEDEVSYAALDAQAVLDKMESAGNGTNLVILDACRDNPFARTFRSARQGLAQMDAPVGTLVAFATSPGAVAADGSGRNGLYTSHLLGAIRLPGLKVEDVFKQVRSAVRRASAGRQVPWESTSLEGDFYFVPPVPVEPAPPPDPQRALDDALWALLTEGGRRADLETYLRRFPEGRHAAEARARLADPAAAAARPTPASASAVPSPPIAQVVPASQPASRPVVQPGPRPAPPTTSEPVARPTVPAAPQAEPKSAPGGPAAADDPVETLTPQQREERNRLALQAAAERIAQIDAWSRADLRTQQRIAEIAAWGDERTERRPERPRTNPHGISVGDRYRYRSHNLMRGEFDSQLPLWRIDGLEPDGDIVVNGGAIRLDARGQPHLHNDVRQGAWQEWTPPLPTAEVAAGDTGERRSVRVRLESRSATGVLTQVQLTGTVVLAGIETVVTPAGTFQARRVDANLSGRAERSTGERPFLVRQTRHWYVPGVALPVAIETTERIDGQIEQRIRHELTALDVLEPRRVAGPHVAGR